MTTKKCCCLSTCVPDAAMGEARYSLKEVNNVVLTMASKSKQEKRGNKLDMVNLLIELLGLGPALSRIRFIHVSGTKGKGSTSWYISNFLGKAYGKRVGLFTSPHLTDVRERFLVNNAKLPESTFAHYFCTVQDRIYEKTHEDPSLHYLSEDMSLFCFFFLLGIYIFEQENVEIAVIEVGIGGLLDTTNVISSEVSVITALGHDHMEILGDTMELIAEQKAGIIKPQNTACFCFSQVDYPLTREVVKAQAEKCGVTVFFHDCSRFPLASSWPAKLGMGGEHLRENSMVGLQVARYVAYHPTAEALGEAAPAYLVVPLSPEELSILLYEGYPGRSQFWEWKRAPLSSGDTCELPACHQEGSGEEEKGAAAGTSALPSRVFFYLDGAHTPESMHYGTKWFIEDSAFREAEEQKRRLQNRHDTHAKLPSPDPTGKDAAFIPPPTTTTTTTTTTTSCTISEPTPSPHRILCFYTSRPVESLFRAITPYAHLFDKVLMVQVHSPKKLTNSPSPSDLKGWNNFSLTAAEMMKASWERTFPNGCPCEVMPIHLTRIEDLIPHIVPVRSSTDTTDTSHASDSVIPHVFVTGSLFLVADILGALTKYEEENL